MLNAYDAETKVELPNWAQRQGQLSEEDVLYRFVPEEPQPPHPLSYKVDEDLEVQDNVVRVHVVEFPHIYVPTLLNLVVKYVQDNMTDLWKKPDPNNKMTNSDIRYWNDHVWHAFKVGDLQQHCGLILSPVPTTDNPFHYNVVCIAATPKQEVAQALSQVQYQDMGPIIIDFYANPPHPGPSPPPPPSSDSSSGAPSSPSPPSFLSPSMLSTSSTPSASPAASNILANVAERNALSHQKKLPFNATLIVRALIAYTVFAVNKQIPELEEEADQECLIDEVRDRVPQCQLLAGTILASNDVDYAQIQSSPVLSDLVRCACAYYMKSDDPWIAEKPSGQSKLLGFLTTFATENTQHLGAPTPSRRVLGTLE